MWCPPGEVQVAAGTRLPAVVVVWRGVPGLRALPHVSIWWIPARWKCWRNLTVGLKGAVPPTPGVWEAIRPVAEPRWWMVSCVERWSAPAVLPTDYVLKLPKVEARLLAAWLRHGAPPRVYNLLTAAPSTEPPEEAHNAVAHGQEEIAGVPHMCTAVAANVRWMSALV